MREFFEPWSPPPNNTMNDDQFKVLTNRLELLRVMLEEHEKTSQLRGVLISRINPSTWILMRRSHPSAKAHWPAACTTRSRTSGPSSAASFRPPIGLPSADSAVPHRKTRHP